MKFGLRTFIIFIFLTANFLLLNSCSFSNRNVTHILILAVDQFGYDNLKCNKETVSAKSGIEILCHDSIRFTHAYTTSQQTRPALTSIFTGQLPFANHVQDNDVRSLSANELTIAEAAAKNGYETAFFVGAPVTMRNSGLQQGFHFFDDHALHEKTLPFRHFQESQISYLNWRGRQFKPTFAVIHIPDLYFKNRPTQTEFGEPRNYSYESQFEEFDQSLFQLIQQLKKVKEYDNTLLILAGLNSPDHIQQEIARNLNYNQDQIALLIKSTQKPRDNGLSWTYDENVSLVDLGRSFFDFLNKDAVVSKQIMTMSLFPNESNHHLTKVSSRWLISETYSHFKNEVGTISLRKNQFHLVYQNKSVKIFNTLIDKLENSPLSQHDPVYIELTTEVKELIDLIRKDPFQSYEIEKNDVTASNDFLNQQDRWKNNHDDDLQNLCLKELMNTSNFMEFNLCRDKKILFLNELNQSKSELTNLQKKRITNLQFDLHNLANAMRTNQELGYLQIQPYFEMKRWRPFLIALHHPHFAKAKSFLMKVENR